jgi:hypothetical protein
MIVGVGEFMAALDGLAFQIVHESTAQLIPVIWSA